MIPAVSSSSSSEAELNFTPPTFNLTNSKSRVPPAVSRDGDYRGMPPEKVNASTASRSEVATKKRASKRNKKLAEKRGRAIHTRSHGPVDSPADIPTVPTAEQQPSEIPAVPTAEQQPTVEVDEDVSGGPSLLEDNNEWNGDIWNYEKEGTP